MKPWTPKEYEYLEENWGRFTIPQLAKKLNRTENAVKIKIFRRGLGRAVENANCLNANQLSDLMKIDSHTVTDYWIPKCGLKAKRKAPHGERKQWFINMESLLSWLEENQDKWDSRKVEKFAFGLEPEWLVRKREIDKTLPARKLQKWTEVEDNKAIILFKTGLYTYKQIGDMLGRSTSSVKHRICRLDVWGTGKYIFETDRKLRKSVNQQRLYIFKLLILLKIRKDKLNFDGYWQKDICQHWCDLKGCTANETNCDECVSFQRIRPQYCHLCGATIWNRNKKNVCDKCSDMRKKQYKKKHAILNKKYIKGEE